MRIRELLGGQVRYIAKAVTRFFLILSALFAALPGVFALEGRTGISPVNRVIELLSYMFNVPILQNERVEEGFIRFALFIVFVAIAHYAFRKARFDNKTSGIISAVFGLIAAFLMPDKWVFANGGVITAVFTGLIPLGLVAGGLYMSTVKMNGSFVMRLLGLIILFTLLGVINVYYTALNLPMVLFLTPSLMKKFWGEEKW